MHLFLFISLGSYNRNLKIMEVWKGISSFCSVTDSGSVLCGPCLEVTRESRSWVWELGLDGLKPYTFQPTCTIQAHFELSIILKLGDLGRTCEREGKRVGVVVGVGNRKIDFEGSKKRGRGSKGHVQEIWAWG